MSIERLTGDDSLQVMKERVAAAIKDPAVKVFQVFGYSGIGKRTLVRDLLEEEKIPFVEHDYAFIESGEFFPKKIQENADSIHLWDDAFKNLILHPEIFSTLKGIRDGSIDFTGTFLLIAMEAEFPDREFPPFPGVFIDFEDEKILIKHLYEEAKRQGLSDEQARMRVIRQAKVLKG